MTTIVAVATPPGVGGVGMLRISGPESLACLKHLVSQESLEKLREKPRYLWPLTVWDATTEKAIDHGMGVFFKAPGSYTGEDVVELHLHGNPLILKTVISKLTQSGARLAQAGEFTRRAFLNGKMDLLQAESVNATVEARNEEILRRSLRQYEGHLSRSIQAQRQELLRALAEIEVSLDYPEDYLARGLQEKLLSTIDACIARLSALTKDTLKLKRVEQGVKVVIAGRPNAGKSSLFNKLLGEEKAIVSDLPGTTRDCVEAPACLEEFLFCFIDTAGLREAGDVIERLGIAKTKNALETAGLVLYVVDAAHGLSDEDTKWQKEIERNEIPLMTVLNKTDLQKQANRSLPDKGIAVSAQNGTGISALKQKMLQMTRLQFIQSTSEYYLNERQYAQVMETIHCLNALKADLSTSIPMDMWTIGLRQSIQIMGKLSGENVTDDYLDKIFANFCIGK
jgi:tRNA modification GTPase